MLGILLRRAESMEAIGAYMRASYAVEQAEAIAALHSELAQLLIADLYSGWYDNMSAKEAAARIRRRRHLALVRAAEARLEKVKSSLA